MIRSPGRPISAVPPEVPFHAHQGYPGSDKCGTVASVLNDQDPENGVLYLPSWNVEDPAVSPSSVLDRLNVRRGGVRVKILRHILG